ncbi:hypothetical protein BaRGS_00032855 [Batillaria attramentaria]|uniref:C2H2-type domain-containing protein n=1 Tax=Batillaria attramentaria TaxID=370345 RepID=A0ABD0JLR0_9CAEN
MAKANKNKDAAFNVADIDFSVIRTAIEAGGKMIDQLMNGVHYGSPEIRLLLRDECDIILECRVCRALFRSLPNFVAHKRVYCPQAFSDHCRNHGMFTTPFPPPKDPEVVVVEPTAPPEAKNGQDARKKNGRNGEESGRGSRPTVQTQRAVRRLRSKSNSSENGDGKNSANNDSDASRASRDGSRSSNSGNRTKSDSHQPDSRPAADGQGDLESLSETVRQIEAGTIGNSPAFILYSAAAEKISRERMQEDKTPVHFAPIASNPNAVFVRTGEKGQMPVPEVDSGTARSQLQVDDGPSAARAVNAEGDAVTDQAVKPTTVVITRRAAMSRSSLRSVSKVIRELRRNKEEKTQKDAGQSSQHSSRTSRSGPLPTTQPAPSSGEARSSKNAASSKADVTASRTAVKRTPSMSDVPSAMSTRTSGSAERPTQNAAVVRSSRVAETKQLFDQSDNQSTSSSPKEENIPPTKLRSRGLGTQAVVKRCLTGHLGAVRTSPLKHCAGEKEGGSASGSGESSHGDGGDEEGLPGMGPREGGTPYDYAMDMDNIRCRICKMSFVQRRSLIYHCRARHSGQRTIFPCPYCPRVFYYLYGLTRHLNTNHKKSHSEIDRMRKKLRQKAYKQEFREPEKLSPERKTASVLSGSGEDIARRTSATPKAKPSMPAWKLLSRLSQKSRRTRNDRGRCVITLEPEAAASDPSDPPSSAAPSKRDGSGSVDSAASKAKPSMPAWTPLSRSGQNAPASPAADTSVTPGKKLVSPASPAVTRSVRTSRTEVAAATFVKEASLNIYRKTYPSQGRSGRSASESSRLQGDTPSSVTPGGVGTSRGRQQRLTANPRYSSRRGNEGEGAGEMDGRTAKSRGETPETSTGSSQKSAVQTRKTNSESQNREDQHEGSVESDSEGSTVSSAKERASRMVRNERGRFITMLRPETGDPSPSELSSSVGPDTPDIGVDPEADSKPCCENASSEREKHILTEGSDESASTVQQNDIVSADMNLRSQDQEFVLPQPPEEKVETGTLTETSVSRGHIENKVAEEKSRLQTRVRTSQAASTSNVADFALPYPATNTGENVSNLHICPHCQRAFSRKISLETHVKICSKAPVEPAQKKSAVMTAGRSDRDRSNTVKTPSPQTRGADEKLLSKAPQEKDSEQNHTRATPAIKAQLTPISAAAPTSQGDAQRESVLELKSSLGLMDTPQQSGGTGSKSDVSEVSETIAPHSSVLPAHSDMSSCQDSPVEKRKRGRPRGGKYSAFFRDQSQDSSVEKRGRGRPPGKKVHSDKDAEKSSEVSVRLSRADRASRRDNFKHGPSSRESSVDSVGRQQPSGVSTDSVSRSSRADSVSRSSLGDSVSGSSRADKSSVASSSRDSSVESGSRTRIRDKVKTEPAHQHLSDQLSTPATGKGKSFLGSKDGQDRSVDGVTDVQSNAGLMLGQESKGLARTSGQLQGQPLESSLRPKRKRRAPCRISDEVQEDAGESDASKTRRVDSVDDEESSMDAVSGSPCPSEEVADPSVDSTPQDATLKDAGSGAEDEDDKTVRLVEEIWMDKKPGRPSERVRSNRIYVIEPARAGRLTCQDTRKVGQIVDEGGLACRQCQQRFTSVSNLRRHAIRHLGWRRFKCRLCRFCSYNRSECNTHILRAHPERLRASGSGGPRIDSFITDLNRQAASVRSSKKRRTLNSRRSEELNNIYLRPKSRRKASAGAGGKQQNEGKTLAVETSHLTGATTSAVAAPSTPPRPTAHRRKSLTPTSREESRRTRMNIQRFNISTRNSPRKFDTRPYQEMDTMATLCTRKGFYTKPVASLPAGKPTVPTPLSQRLDEIQYREKDFLEDNGENIASEGEEDAPESMQSSSEQTERREDESEVKHDTSSDEEELDLPPEDATGGEAEIDMLELLAPHDELPSVATETKLTVSQSLRASSSSDKSSSVSALESMADTS